MTQGNLRRVILSFALPMMLSGLFQQLYNTADSLIVGKLLGKDALAAVSSSSPLVQLLTALMVGIAMGAGVVISRHFGAGEHETVSDSIHTAVSFALIAGAVLTLAGVLLSPILLRSMGTPPEVLKGSIEYFRNYFLGAMAGMLYNVFTGIMSALGDSRRPLYYLIFSSLLNIALDLLFIAVFKRSVGSAATATAISQAASALLCFLYLRKPGRLYTLRLSRLRIHRSLMGEILRMGLPTGIQNSVISIANVLVQSNINSFGADAVAACGTYAKLQGFAFIPITSFAMALTTFISQNLGAKQYARAKKGAWFGILSMAAAAELIGLALVLLSRELVGLFNSDPKVIEIASEQSLIESLFFALLAFSHAVAGVLRGAGKAIVPMLVMLLDWCALRILYITVAMQVKHEIHLLFWAYPITWTISSIVFSVYLIKSDWVHGYEHSSSHHRFRMMLH